jgi:hypothetical protein
VSATGRGAERDPRDHYPTPAWLTRAVLPTLKARLQAIHHWPPRVYEPACGDNLAIVKVLTKEWPEAQVEYSDIIPEHGGVDFLTATPEPIFDLVITNPPYKYAQEFAQRSRLWLRQHHVRHLGGDIPGLVSLLLRINFYGSIKRAEWLRNDTPNMAVSPKRPVMGVNKHGKPGTDATEYAWLTWPSWDPMITILETEDIEGR